MLTTNGVSNGLGYVPGRENYQFRGDRQAEGKADLKNATLLIGRNAVDTLPRVNVRGRLGELLSHGPNSTEEFENRLTLFHGQRCAKNLHNKQVKICTDYVQVSCTLANVTDSVNIRLKELRLSAIPKLTIRGMADELGIGYSRYAYFEDPKRFKKRQLPLDLTRQITDVLSRHGVDPVEVMKLAGLEDEEAAPEVRKIEAAKPVRHFINLPVALPSEGALAAMFETLLALIPPDATRAEAARILAQRLPTGFAAIGPDVIELESDEATDDGVYPPIVSRDHRGSPRPSRR